ncbi:MAG: 2-C-methyl-D-erythritol 4-phosphate cytidylyltransferase, partial [Candidatus Limnocylindrales bacterium]
MGRDGYADAVIVAAGESRRMGGPDKLMASLSGRPLLAWTVEALARTPAVGSIVVVAAPGRASELRDAAWLRATGARVVVGGARRQDSSAAGLAATRPDSEVVLIHDGARPFVSAALAQTVAEAARAHGAAIPVEPISDSVKRVADGRVTAGVDRAGLCLAQTPQGARRSVLVQAFAGPLIDQAGGYPDEAALLAAAGIEVVAVPGEADNLKVTTPADLRRAEAIAARLVGALLPRLPADALAGPIRMAHSHDSHPFGPSDGLALGGIVIPEAPRLHGHSDGDALLHVIADAILGGARLGDLGRRFPAEDPTTRGIASAELLREVARQAAAAGWRAAAVDLVLEGARPTLGAARLEAMRAAVAGLLDLDPG